MGAMLAATSKSDKKNRTSTSQHNKLRTVIVAAPESRIEFPRGQQFPIQRKCACGGSCPSCSAKDEFIQPKLKIGAPNDKYEQEADQVADQVMRMPDPKIQPQPIDNQNKQLQTKSLAVPITPLVQRQEIEDEKEELEEESEEDVIPIQAKPLASTITPFVQRQAMDEEGVVQTKSNRHTAPMMTPSISADIQSLQGGGQPLSRSARGFFEPRIGADFSNVRVHNDTRATRAAKSVNARAFTLGHDVVFGAGEYSPDTTSGRKLLAHELTHTIQQSHIATSGEEIRVQRDEFEPWPGQIGHDVAGTREREGDIIREQVQRLGDPTYTQLGPMLLEFNTVDCVLTVKKQLNFVNAGAGDQRLSVDDFNEFKARILGIANDQLNGWVSINVEQSDGCTLTCDDGEITVNVETEEGTGSYSSTINLHRTFGRENAGNIGADASDRTIWHEVGHVVLGAADEYAESSRPDSTPRPSSRVNESDWSIMSSEGNARRAIMHARHFSHLTAWLGRRFPDCTFELNESSRPIVVEFSPSFLLGGYGTSEGGGFYYSAGLDLGIPLDRLRRLELILGARFNYMVELSPEIRHSLLLGFRAGLQGQFGSSGIRLGGFAEGGGIGFTDIGAGEFGTRGYVEGGLNFGYSSGGSFDIGLEAAGGRREFDISESVTGGGTETEFLPYFRLGVVVGGSF